MNKGTEYYATAIEISDVRGKLNTSYGMFTASFFATDSAEATQAMEQLKAMIEMRETQIREAKKLLADYAQIVADGGPEAHAENQRAAFKAEMDKARKAMAQ